MKNIALRGFFRQAQHLVLLSDVQSFMLYFAQHQCFISHRDHESS